ncbi:unnamed protein product [Phytophthora lilii]|uniref:Unnamed protein product n=1 Tax=Phytophthora lilii TaxID=2077276 RepID=A0A9W6UB11_9STRA|nr:unnamed protein product [Phytophthora lilii]
MKFTLPKSTFPKLELSKDLQDAMIEEADTVVKEILAANEAFLADGGTLRDPQWRHIRTKEGLQVYRQRKSAIRQQKKESISPVLESPSWSTNHTLSRYRGNSYSLGSNLKRDTSLSSSSGIAEDSIMEKMRPSGVSLMALHGTMAGSLDDCMFGSFAPNDEEWKLRSSHINDKLDDARILATIREPTRTDPLQFLCVKWFAMEHPVVLTGIVQQRDFLIMESTGFTRDSKGEKVGYFLMHSVTLREIPELSHLGIVRGLMSFCYLFRQGGSGKVEVYCRGFFDSRGEMPVRVSVAIASEAAICCAGLVDFAYIKKLAWLMKHSSKRQPAAENQCSHCEACDKSFNKFSLSSSGSSTTCQICRLVVCGKCSVAKKMTLDVSDTGSVQQRSLSFCLSCLLKAKEYPALKMALSDLEASSRSRPAALASRCDSLLQTRLDRRQGRSYSEFRHADSPFHRPAELSSSNGQINYPGNFGPNGRATNLPPAGGERFHAWSPHSDKVSRGPNSERGIRYCTSK